MQQQLACTRLEQVHQLVQTIQLVHQASALAIALRAPRAWVQQSSAGAMKATNTPGEPEAHAWVDVRKATL